MGRVACRIPKACRSFFGLLGALAPIVSGGDIEEVTPDPISNSEVKLLGANGTAREAVWESRKPLGLMLLLSIVFGPVSAVVL
jgi:hypothetical protein